MIRKHFIDQLNTEEELLDLYRKIYDMGLYADAIGLQVDVEEEKRYILQKIKEIKQAPDPSLSFKYIVKIYLNDKEGFTYNVYPNTKEPFPNTICQRERLKEGLLVCPIRFKSKPILSEKDGVLHAIWFTNDLGSGSMELPQEVKDSILQKMNWCLLK